MKRWLVCALSLLATQAWATTSITVNSVSYNLGAHPRVFFDSGGAVTTAIKDPDGAGPLVAPRAVDSNPAYVAMKAYIRTCVASDPPCDLITNFGAFADGIELAALDWYMDNSQTNSLRAAKYWINNVEANVNPGWQFGADIVGVNIGMGDWSDWPSGGMIHFAFAYTLIQDQLTAGERTAFAQKVFTDVDSHGNESGCNNQLQQKVGAVATNVSGSTAVTGSGFTGLTAGRRVYIQPAYPSVTTGGWAYISTVNSDSSITLTTAPKVWSGGNAASVTSGRIFELQPLVAGTTCGWAWQMSQMHWMPQVSTMLGTVSTTLVGAIGTGNTSIVVASTSGFPTAPFYIWDNYGEVMKVTNVAGTTLTVTRGPFGSAVSAANGAIVRYSPYLPNTGAEVTHNLTITKVAGLTAIALALADENATAASWAGRGLSDWITLIAPKNKDLWTGGFTQAGSSSYGTGRQAAYNAHMAVMAKLVDPALDQSGTTWLKKFPYFLHGLLPGTTNTFLPWGQADIATTTSYAAQNWFPFIEYLFGASANEQKYWNYWQKTYANLYTSATLSGSNGFYQIPWAIMWLNESDPTTNFTTALPLQRTFNVNDNSSTKALNWWISRTGWTSTDTLVALSAYQTIYNSDHMGNGNHGGYRIYRGAWQLTENTNSGNTHTGTSYNTNGFVNTPVFGGINPQIVNSLNQPGVTISGSFADDAGGKYAFARVNMQPSYVSTAHATRALRYIAHMKKPGSQDYVVVYDDVASSSGNTKAMALSFDKQASGTAMTTATLPNLVWTGTNGRLNTQVLLPSGANAVLAANSPSPTNAYESNVCISADSTTCDATNTSGEFLVAHMPSTNTSSTMPTTALHLVMLGFGRFKSPTRPLRR